MPDGDRSDSEIIQNEEVSVHAGRGLYHTDLEVGERDQLGVDEMVQFGVSWNAIHNVKFWVLIGEGDGWHHISSKVNTEDEYGGQWEWCLEHDEEDEWSDLGNVGGKSVSN